MAMAKHLFHQMGKQPMHASATLQMSQAQFDTLSKIFFWPLLPTHSPYSMCSHLWCKYTANNKDKNNCTPVTVQSNQNSHTSYTYWWFPVIAVFDVHCGKIWLDIIWKSCFFLFQQFQSSVCVCTECIQAQLYVLDTCNTHRRVFMHKINENQHCENRLLSKVD